MQRSEVPRAVRKANRCTFGPNPPRGGGPGRLDSLGACYYTLDVPDPRRRMTCPTCRKAIELDRGHPSFPFCSERCKMVDLGRWLAGEYVISRPIDPESESDAEAISEAARRILDHGGAEDGATDDEPPEVTH